MENKDFIQKDNFDLIQNIHIVAYEPAFSIIGDPEKKNAKTRQSADHSMVYIVSTMLRKAIEDEEFINKLKDLNSLNEIWKSLILLPEDYSQKAIKNANTIKLVNKTTFEHGGKEYDEKYPEGIPTSIKISLTDGRVLDSKLVMFPAGHSKNVEADLNGILENKFRLFGKIALGDC